MDVLIPHNLSNFHDLARCMRQSDGQQPTITTTIYLVGLFHFTIFFKFLTQASLPTCFCLLLDFLCFQLTVNNFPPERPQSTFDPHFVQDHRPYLMEIGIS